MHGCLGGTRQDGVDGDILTKKKCVTGGLQLGASLVAFLPGYNFPRFPLSAYVPGRRRVGRDEFVSRARFLEIAEFEPRTLVIAFLTVRFQDSVLAQEIEEQYFEGKSDDSREENAP